MNDFRDGKLGRITLDDTPVKEMKRYEEIMKKVEEEEEAKESKNGNKEKQT